MATRINPPEFKGKSYERYKRELKAWSIQSQKKKGITIALSFPEDDEFGIREKVFDELSLHELIADDCLDKLITFLDSKLLKDDLADSWDKFSDFEEYQRGKHPPVSDFIQQFDQKYNSNM